MKSKYLYILISAIVISITGCERDLELYPLTQLSLGSFFKNEADFKMYTNRFYEFLPAHGAIHRDEDADITFNSSAVSNGTYIPGPTSSFYNGSYDQIRAINELLEAVEKVEDESLKESVQVYKGEALFFRAYKYWLLYRDYGGVIIVDRPLGVEDELLYSARNTREEVTDFILNDLDEALKTPVGTLSGPENVGRISREAVLALKARVALFEGTWAKYHGTGADYNNYLQQAIDASEQILDEDKYELFDRRDVLGEESYRYYFTLEYDRKSNPAGLTKADQNETILATIFDQTLRSYSGMVVMQWPRLSPTRKMMDMYLDESGLPIAHASSVFEGYQTVISDDKMVGVNHEFEKRDPRMRLNTIQPLQHFWYHVPYQRDFTETDEELLGTGQFHNGWNSQSRTGYGVWKWCTEIAKPYANDYPIIRLAEVMLIYAEATFEKNGAISDEELNKSINKLRLRVGMPVLNNQFITDNGLDMLSEIRRERAVELFAEGFRYDDIRRWKIADDVMAKDVKGMKWGGTIFEDTYEIFDPAVEQQVVEIDNRNAHSYELDGDGFVIVEAAAIRNWEAKHYLKPLPLQELQVNENLKQNPGWISVVTE